MAVSDEMQILGEWCEQLARALQIPDLDVDQELLLDLARKSADSVIHAAAPVTAFMVGYVAGHEAGRGNAGSEGSRSATARAADIAFGLCEQRASSQSVSGPEQKKQS
ncbi:DUF6457 domain-containing protein [Arthrobacter sp. ISL-65]|uniref:DUF6457 domain-containing protein n=1 Tax=Arthrobacter sp. ISL-65 TaxID=2819112 RepID=UPI001BED037A|nr:DUF6457 domain-containing protein [Arthrobacter sp. ISL-65]MBT2551312.1 molybdopterin-guanine dinucleotide biosynthesis protein [Arthrobacter sp. ISL-65]